MSGLPSASRLIESGLTYLISSQSADGGWGGAADTPSTVEETALAMTALRRLSRYPCHHADSVLRALARGDGWLNDRLARQCTPAPSPIGFYFAKLWYSERTYPLVFAAGAMALE